MTKKKENIFKSVTYKSSGVDIDKFEIIFKDLKKEILGTFNEAVINNYGGFSSVLDIKKLGYKDPLILSSADGVGTKLRLAIEVNKLDNIGIDVVAMCVNDILAQGGLPHFFLDYIAVGKLNIQQIKSTLKSIIRGCIIANCSLVGGETAEMPGHYVKNNFDIAGFSIGAVERKKILYPTLVRERDIVIAVGSNGVHSNGFSLIRKLIKIYSIDISKEKFTFDSKKNIAETLLKPTYIYTDILRLMPNNIKVNGITHITGGGLIENPKRSFTNDLTLSLDFSTYNIDPLFLWIKKKGNLDWYELFKTFNCGIGLLIYVNEKHVPLLINHIKKANFKPWVVGVMKKNKNKKSIEILNYEKN